MTNLAEGGIAGSLRSLVDREVRRHLNKNPAIRSARYALALRALRYFLADRAFGWFLGLYVTIDVLLLLCQALFSTFLPSFWEDWMWSGADPTGLLKDATGFFITAQVGALGIVSIAVGLVTLIAQRQDSSTDVRIYYHESLAQEVVASSIVLLTILCVQIFWPGQFIARAVGYSAPISSFETILTLVHVTWLGLNLWALAHFVSLSLKFVQLSERENIRETYTANWVVPNDITSRLQRQFYLMAHTGLIDGVNQANTLTKYSSWPI
jgi:hypothetical protein